MVDFACPPDWCHVSRDVASASDLSVAAAIAGASRCRARFLLSPILTDILDGVRRMTKHTQTGKQHQRMTVHLVNPSHLSFGVGVITPRWLFVLAGATPPEYGRPHLVD